jgi:hypothetical protein
MAVVPVVTVAVFLITAGFGGGFASFPSQTPMVLCEMEVGSGLAWLLRVTAQKTRLPRKNRIFGMTENVRGGAVGASDFMLSRHLETRQISAEPVTRRL